MMLDTYIATYSNLKGETVSNHLEISRMVNYAGVWSLAQANTPEGYYLTTLEVILRSADGVEHVIELVDPFPKK